MVISAKNTPRENSSGATLQGLQVFNCHLEYGGKLYVNGVAFPPGKGHILKKYSDNKTPIKISKYSIDNHYGSTSLAINDKTFFKDASKSNFEPDQGKENEDIFLGNLNNIAYKSRRTIDTLRRNNSMVVLKQDKGRRVVRRSSNGFTVSTSISRYLHGRIRKGCCTKVITTYLVLEMLCRWHYLFC